MYSIGNQGKIMRKLLGKPTVDSAHDVHTPGAAVTSSPITPHYRPTVSQDVIHEAGVPIACLDRSPDGRSAVLAGRHVLKTVNLDGLDVTEGIDLRALIIAQPSQRNSMPTSVADQLSVKAVKWGEPQGKQVIFTAGTSGKIFHYDLVRAGATSLGSPVDCVQIREDSRQVNALDINPHRNSWLLSGSQDGIVRCFDVRQPTQTRAGATFRSIQAFKCNADAVQHVEWNPRDGFLFGCATEQGFVLKWDMRKPSAPILRIKAHEKACTAMAWHPDGVHLVSGGMDNKCSVWDMSKQDKRQKPKWTLSTPAPPGTLAWRPGQWSATAQGKRASQLAVAYDETSQKRYGINVVHIWDLARPTMPYKEVQRFDASPSAMLWHDQYLLWTAGQDGVFSQCDISFAPKVIDRQAVSTMAFSPRGEVLMLLDERAPPPRLRPHNHHSHHNQHHPHPQHHSHEPQHHHPNHPVLHHESDVAAVTSYSPSPTTPRFSVSRSDSEDDAIGSFIGPKMRGGSRRRRPSTRSTATLSTTPPAGPTMEEVMSLEQTIKATGTHKPQQAMAVGHVPAAANVDLYGYLAVNYLEALYRDLPYTDGAGTLPERVAVILEHYARAAASVKQYRLAQTWRILAYAVDMLLHRRAQYHLDRRMDRQHDAEMKKSEAKAKAKAKALDKVFHPTPIQPTTATSVSVIGEETPRKVSSSLVTFDKALHPRSLLAEEFESTSNVPTPVARPVQDSPDGVHARLERERGRKLTPIVEPESFTLPPAVHPGPPLAVRKRLDSVPVSVVSHGSENTYASTEGYDFYDTEAMLDGPDDVISPRPDPTQVHDYTGHGSSPGLPRRPILRQDSEESYVHLFAITDESRRSTARTVSSEGSLAADSVRIGAPGGNTQHDGGEEDVEFASRIRGEEIHASPERVPLPLPFRAMLGRTDTNMTNMTSFTDEHHAITQTTTDSFESPYASQHDDDAVVVSSPLLEGEREQELEDRSSSDSPVLSPHTNDTSPFIVETDYLCWPDDAPFPYPIDPASGFSAVSSVPLQPYPLIARALAFEAKSSALNASAIVLLLKPLLPDDIIDHYQAAAILRQHHARLMSMKLFTEAALLRKLCMKGWPGGTLADWGVDYPAVFTAAQQGVQASFFCTSCRKPREVDRSAASIESVWQCERCRAAMAGCAVCGGRDVIIPSSFIPLPSSSSPFSEESPSSPSTTPPLTTWWYCPGCGHGGHASCLQSWHATLEATASDSHYPYSPSSPLEDPPHALSDPSDGCCPLDGCGHACLPSRRADLVYVNTGGGDGSLTPLYYRSDEPSSGRGGLREATRAAMAKANVAAAASAAAATAAAERGVGAAAEVGSHVLPGMGEGRLLGDELLQHQHGAGLGFGGPYHHYGSGRHPGSVRSDGHDIPQSRAVETVRETLGGTVGLGVGGASAGVGGGLSGARVGTGILSSSPGRGGILGVGNERERRKSVKFVATDERR
ncbi:uncharacterized protein C8A04DRAFT_11906 [Dichotomopilus funicola]|uniref:Uncharacterized protein n=1 Tax=Dichotomopilus funicola TaxID=1934379 RepID=A0AAN6V359_9PEZI|nr:hypothetical protein C8A04DRAFT_11906 [Dichotomopilus funicola]